MKKFRILIGCAAASVALAACVKVSAGSPYSVTVPMTDDDNDFVAYLVDFDSGDKIDSTVVTGNRAVFDGTVDSPRMTTLTLGGSRMGTFILEPGEIMFHPDTRIATGTPLNVRLNAVSDSLTAIERQYRSLPRDTAFEANAERLIAQFNAMQNKIVDDNADNPIGLYFFLQGAYECPTLDSLDSELKKYPAFTDSKRVAKLRASFKAKEETSPGHRFKDFAIHNQANDSTQRLSDYVGRGKWTLVDFWASWCGPCIRETKVLKEILADYGPLGLEVLGVAVWDQPENTLEAIKRHQLPWPQIIGAQTIPTDLYGISGIPCIILIDPEGNIVARDLQDEALKEAVRNALLKE